MKRLLLVISIAMLVAITSQAAKWRVNNTGGGADFSNITDAQSAAASGDTIYIEGSSLQYTTPSLTKKLVIIGPGFFLVDNSNTQANKNSARISGFTFNSGSMGSIIQGVEIVGIVTISVDSITLKRNYIHYSSTGYKGVVLASGTKGSVITQNYIVNSANYAAYGALTIESSSIGHIISNNYMVNSSGTGGAYPSLLMNSNAQAQIVNNVFGSMVTIVNSSFHNNILTIGSFESSGSVVTHNIGNSTQFPLPDNLQSVDMNLVFDLANTSTDGKYQLIGEVGTNPAIGYGVLGEDCGMFGGSNPYVLSGVPALPSVYFFYAAPSASSASGLPTSIKVKSNR
jgi:hypothetical protein